MSNQSACMYCVLIFIAEEKIGGFQPIVESSADASRAWCVPNSGRRAFRPRAPERSPSPARRRWPAHADEAAAVEDALAVSSHRAS
jgi:hypothetical protein